MISQPDYSPCDGNELCYQLRQLDTDLRDAYQVYDSFALPEEKPQPKEKPQTDKVETFVKLLRRQEPLSLVVLNSKIKQKSPCKNCKMQ